MKKDLKINRNSFHVPPFDGNLLQSIIWSRVDLKNNRWIFKRYVFTWWVFVTFLLEIFSNKNISTLYLYLQNNIPLHILYPNNVSEICLPKLLHTIETFSQVNYVFKGSCRKSEKVWPKVSKRHLDVTMTSKVNAQRSLKLD